MSRMTNKRFSEVFDEGRAHVIDSDDPLTLNREVAKEFAIALYHERVEVERLRERMKELPTKLLAVRQNDLDEINIKTRPENAHYCYGWRDAAEHLPYIIKQAEQEVVDED